MKDITWSMTLYRFVNEKKRYYALNIYPTLFGEYLLEKRYGSIKNVSPTRVVKEYYKTLSDALDGLNEKVKQKYKKGYWCENDSK
jgi:predicted DNA-binding WGR domain protein